MNATDRLNLLTLLSFSHVLTQHHREARRLRTFDAHNPGLILDILALPPKAKIAYDEFVCTAPNGFIPFPMHTFVLNFFPAEMIISTAAVNNLLRDILRRVPERVFASPVYADTPPEMKKAIAHACALHLPPEGRIDLPQRHGLSTALLLADIYWDMALFPVDGYTYVPFRRTSLLDKWFARA